MSNNNEEIMLRGNKIILNKNENIDLIPGAFE